jgi:hypothetical protein
MLYPPPIIVVQAGQTAGAKPENSLELDVRWRV